MLALCAAFLIAGCASKSVTKTGQPPIAGMCGIKQDVCRRGTPSATGDTTAPYGWTCLGLYGGADDTCSAPIAAIGDDEFFAGQNDLVTRLKAAGPLRGEFVIFDGTIDSDNPSHATAMRLLALKHMEVPEENLTVTAAGIREFSSGPGLA